MPDFDKDLQPIIQDTKPSNFDLDIKAPTPVAPMSTDGGGRISDYSGSKSIFDKLADDTKTSTPAKGVFVTDKELDANKRYTTFNPTVGNYEDFAAYGQSNWDKATNGVLKGLNLAGTTIAGSFAMLGGVAVAATSGRLADIWDNAATRRLDEWNTKVDQEYLPNYYTDAEKNAAWYSTDNWITTNFLFDKLIKNAGFAVGAMVTGNIANAGLLKAGAAIGKAASAGAAAAEASQAFKLFTPLLRNTARAFSAGKNIEAAAILEKEISSIADLSAKSTKLANAAIARTTNQFASFGNEARRTIISAYSAAGEASFEALGTAKEYRNNLIEQWKETHNGFEPTGQDLRKINEDSESVGKTSFFGNLALLGITEYVQLPKQLGSTYSASKKTANSLLGEAGDVVLKEAKYAAKRVEATTLKGKLYEGTKRISSKLLTGGSTYLFDPKEALQEGLQYGLQVGTQNYYNKAYQTKDADVWTDGFLYGLVGEDEEGRGVGALVSKEGMESIALGGITGGLMQIKGNIQQAKALKSNTQKFINGLNNAPTFKAAFQDKLASANRGIVLQQQQQDEVVKGDKLEAIDLDNDITHNYLAPRIKYGRFDMVMGDIQDLKQQGVTEEGLSELKEQGLANINDTIESYQKRLTSFEKVAINTNELYKSTDLRYSGEILKDDRGEPVLDMDGRQQRKYSPQVIDKMIYAVSKVTNYDVRIPQVNSILSEYGINTGDILQSIIDNNKPNREATDAVLKQINEMKGVTSTVKEELKTALADVIELSLRRNLFLEEYDSIKAKPLNYETKPDFVFGETEEVPVTIIQKDEDNKPVERKLEIGKEYSLKEPVRKEGSTLQLAPKLTIVSQTLGGELEVLLPNGKVKFITPTEFKEYMISDEDNSSEEMTDILNDAIDVVLQREEYKDVPKPVGNKLEFINALDNQKLINDIEKEFNSNAEEILKNKKEAEELEKQIGKNQEDIDKEQKEIEITSGDVQTQDVNSDKVQDEINSNRKEGKLRSADRLFRASITESEGSESPDYQKDPTQSSNHIQRARKFLNNARNSPNRSKMRAIFVTYKNEAALGLKGITQLSYGLNDSDLDTEAKQKAFEKDVTDVENGFLAQVFVVQEGADFYFVDEKGDRIKVDGKDVKMGDQVDIRNQVVFQTQPTTNLKYKNGDPRYRKSEKAKAEALQTAYIKYRKDLFESPANAAPPVFKFIISRGVAVEPTTTKKDADGKDVVVKEKNHVGGVLVPENLISSQQGLIVVPTTGAIEHNGELLKFPNGVPVLQYEDVLQFLNNRKFTSDEAETIYEVINALASETVAQVKAKKPVKFNPAYKEFLKNVLYWKSKQTGIGENQFYISGTNINIGKKSFPIATIANNKDEIISLLENTFANLNNETLSKKFRSPFYEYFVNADGKLEAREWKNYQTYLLGASYPDGTPRAANSAPLSTSVAKPNDAFPYSFKSKYSILSGMDLPIKEAAPVAPVAPAPTAAPVTKVGGYIMDFKTLNTYKLKAGDVQFVAKINDKDKVVVEVLSGETTKKAATDPTYVANAIANLKNIAEDQKKEYNEELSKPENAEAAVMAFQGAAISGALEKIRTEEKAAAPIIAAPVAQTAPVVSDKKADIEKRRQEELDKTLTYKEYLEELRKIKSISGIEYKRIKDLKLGTSATGLAERHRLETTADEKQRIAINKLQTGKTILQPSESIEKINDKYDAELAALEAPVSDIEKLKQTPEGKEIERIRKETLEDNKDNTPYDQAFIDTFGEDQSLLGKYQFDLTPDSEDDNLILVNSIQEGIDKINAKYDAELTALKGGEKSSSKEPKDFGGFGLPKFFRAVVAGEEGAMTDAELQLFKEWHAKNASLIPFEVLDNLITIHGDKKAWGVFENGVAKFVRGGLKGTEYHEIFHGIFQGLLSEEKQQALIAEVNSKEGTFRDRMSDKEIEFSKATPTQAEDYIADQFASFRLGKIKVKSLSERIVNFFKSIVDFVKSFVGNPSLKDELFKAIDAGKFKDAVPGVSKVGPTYRAATDLTELQTHEFVEDMTARAAGIIYHEADKKALFNPLKITSDQMFGRIEAMYESPAEANAQGVTKREFLGDDAWNELVVKTKESLRTLGINFSENDKMNINDEGQTNKLYAPEPFSTDWKKTSPFAIKFSLATLFQVAATNQENDLSLEMPKIETSSVGGFKLINFSRAFATILDRLSNTSSISKAVDKLAELASYDATYVRLFSRIGGSYSTDENGKISKVMNFDQFNNEDWRLFIQMMQTFTKQKPEALIQYKSGNTIHTAPANLFTAIKKQQRVWIESMKSMATSPTSFIRYSSDSKTYKVDVQKIKEIPVPKQPQDMIDFLGKVGVVFPIDVYLKLKSEGANSQTKQFAEAVGAIYSQLGKDGDIYSVTGKALNVDGRFAKLAELYTKVTNPNQDSSYPNVEGETTNAFSENNTPSVFENEFNEADTIEELLKSRPELNDLFSTNSVTLKKGGEFYDENGKKIKEIKIKYIQGTSDSVKNKGITTAKLNLGGRFAQEINQNLNGDYYILIPADSSTEWMINLGNNVVFDDFVNDRADNKIHKIFEGYLLDDVALALDADNRKKIRNVGEKAKELRFFKDILSKDTLSGINELIAKKETTLADVKIFIKNNLADINESVDLYINNTVDKTIDLLKANGEIITRGEDEFSYPSLDDVFVASTDLDKTSLSLDEVTNIIKFANTNYIINNIELHKIIFGDPYNFAIKDKKGKIILDETKRIKSFLSPRRTTFDFPQFNNYLHRERNLAGGIQLTPDDPGYQNFKSYTDTVTFTDVTTASALANTIPLYGKTNEADAMSWLMDGTYREIKLKNGQWTDEAEAFHQWQMAFTRQNFIGYKYSQDARGEALKKHDAKLTSKPSPKHVIEVLKPIVTGVKFGSTIIDSIIDKDSQMPIYYSMVKGKTLEKLYVKMFNEKIGYAIVESGRKVGAEELHSLYNADGSFNDTAFNNRIPVSWKSYGIQVETTQSGEKMQTLGSQITKMSSMDLFENGVASPAAAAEYKRNMKILNDMHRNASSELLKKLGITDTGNGFELKDKTLVSNALVAEMLRREMSDNAKDTVKLDENRQFRIPFEASPSYVQIRNIIYSMIDRAIISPKVSGGAHVQVPVTGFEKATEGRSLIMKNEKGVWEKISKEKYATLDDDQKIGVMLSDDTLKFYEDADGKRHCEIMVPHWFKNKFGKKTDKEILEYLNKKENQSILSGIGFRIPTQSMSSIEVFKVVGFLPQYMGTTVVVPSQITTKAGSDFDIDKLNMYLKSIYVDASGNVKLVQYQGSEESTKEFFSNVYEKTIQNKINKIEKFDEFRDRMLSIASQITTDSDENDGTVESMLSEEDYEFYLTHIDILAQIDEQAEEKDMDTVDYINSQITNLGIAKDKLTAELLSKQLKDDYVSDMYKRSLENEYYDSLEKLVTLPENFKRLISPVDDAGLSAVADELDALTGTNENNIKNRILDRNYMTSLRHAFVVAKRWVGIAAVNITNHSLAQKAMIYISPSRIKSAPKADRKFLKDGSMVLPHNTVEINGEEVISLSGRTVKNGEQFISERLSGYATGFVDVSKDPYIMKLIKSDLIVGTFMFLERVGAGKAGVKFLNQPIISEYIAMLDRKNIKNLFNDDNINLAKSLFDTTNDLIKSVEIGVEEKHLDDNIKNYYINKSLTPTQNAEQHNILDEFLKYAKMAEYNFKFSQATNYDTTKFRSGDTLSRKQMRTSEAIESNIISSVSKILDNSSIGEQEKILSKLAEAAGTIFKLEENQFRVIIDSVLDPYKANEYMSQDNYEKIANKIRASFLDYVVQIQKGINSAIKPLLVDVNTSVANQLAEAKVKYPDVRILSDLEIESSPREGGATTVKLNVNLKDAYDENLYTGMMAELRDNPNTKELFNNLVTLSLLQGTYQSSVSIKNIIPIEDYSAAISPIISSLQPTMDVKAFGDNGSFQRTNFRDDEIMPVFQPKFFLASENPIYAQTNQFGEHYADIFQYYSSLFPNIAGLNIKSTDRRVLKLSEKYNSYDLKNEFIKVPRVVTDRTTGESIDMKTGETITAKDYALRKQKGDTTLNDYFGYMKVRYKVSGEPLISYGEEGEPNHIYKLINLRGDGQYAVEHYADNRKSVINNGTIKMNNELSDEDLIEYYGGELDASDFEEGIDETAQLEVTDAESGEKFITKNKVGDDVKLTWKKLGNIQTAKIISISPMEAGTMDVLVKTNSGKQYMFVVAYDGVVSKSSFKDGLLDYDNLDNETLGVDGIFDLVKSQPSTSVKPTEAVSNVYEKSERIITRTEVKNNPKTLYIFGDNDQRKGLGGQAKEMRGEQNTLGVSTKKYPSNNESSFKTDNELEDNKKIITDDINKVIAEWNTGKYNKVNVPQIGVGLAALPTRAPKTYAFLQEELNRLEKTVSQPTQAAPAVTEEVRYKDKEKRIRIDYPSKIRTEDGEELNSSDLIKMANVKRDSNRIAEQGAEDYGDAIYKKYGEVARELVDETDMELSVPEAEFLRDNPEFGKRFIDSFLNSDKAEGETMSEYAQTLLDQNEILADTAQLSLFEGKEDRKINVNQFNITVTPDGTMYYDNGKEVTDQTIKNKVNIRKELQDGTLRTSVYNNSNYFVLLDGRVLGSGKSNLGKESITDPKIKEAILAKAVTYRKQC